MMASGIERKMRPEAGARCLKNQEMPSEHCYLQKDCLHLTLGFDVGSSLNFDAAVQQWCWKT